MLTKLRDAIILERAVNAHIPDLLRGFVAADWLSNPDHLALTDGRNIALFERVNDDTWVAHSVFEDRGKAALSVGKEMVATMFKHYGAKRIIGEPPVRKIAARWFNRQIGFKHIGFFQTPFGIVERQVMEI